MTQDYLEHYGKKGMKWGVRKKRTLSTPTGKKTVGKGMTPTGKKSTTSSKVKKAAQTKISALNTSRNRKVIKRGAGFVSGILVVAGRKAITSYARQEIFGQLVKRRPITGT